MTSISNPGMRMVVNSSREWDDFESEGGTGGLEFEISKVRTFLAFEFWRTFQNVEYLSKKIPNNSLPPAYKMITK